MQKITFNTEAKEQAIAGINLVANIVGVSMGAMGKTVMIDKGSTMIPNGEGGFISVPYPPMATKDGVSIINEIKMVGDGRDYGIKSAMIASRKTWKDAGDGTTQTPVLLAALVNNAKELMTENINPHEVKSGIEKAVVAVIDNIAKMSVPIGEDNKKIKMVATISANNDEVIGELIASVYDKIGADGHLNIMDSNTIETTIETIAGMEIPKGMVLRDFITDREKMQTEYINPLFFLADYDINHVTEELYPLLADIYNEELPEGAPQGTMPKMRNTNRPLVIIANDFSGEVINSVLENNRTKALQCTLIRTQQPYKENNLMDIAIVTGATVIGDRQCGRKVKDARLIDLGTAQKVVIKEGSTLIFGGAGKLAELESHKASVRYQLENIEDNKRELWEKRLTRLAGQIGIIRVGGATELEIGEKKARIDDAKRAVESAFKEGIVAGGGVALIRCEEVINGLDGTAGERIGYEIVRKSLFAPLAKMLENAGEKNDVIDVVRSNDWTVPALQNCGYNIKTKEFGDMLEMGIVDPAKVIRCALQNASSVANSIITSYCLMSETK